MVSSRVNNNNEHFNRQVKAEQRATLTSKRFVLEFNYSLTLATGALLQTNIKIT